MITMEPRLLKTKEIIFPAQYEDFSSSAGMKAPCPDLNPVLTWHNEDMYSWSCDNNDMTVQAHVPNLQHFLLPS